MSLSASSSTQDEEQRERARSWRAVEERRFRTRRRSSRTMAGASAISLGLILLFALLRSPQIVFVFFLFFFILLGGISISLYMIFSKLDEQDDSSSNEVSDTMMTTSSDFLTSLNVYVKYALKGSDHSRREIAYLLRNVLREDSADKKTGAPDGQFQRDLERVVYAYTTSEGARKKPSRQEREAYLASLERIIKRLEVTTTSKS